MKTPLNRLLIAASAAAAALLADQAMGSEERGRPLVSPPVVAFEYAAVDGDDLSPGPAVVAVAGESSSGTNEEKRVHRGIIIKGIEPDGKVHGMHETTTWLGVSAEEAPEVLSSQLGLDPGVGLVVNYVTPDSPAAKAGLQKNDLLVELEGQSLVVPGQLRRLVQARKEGDQVTLDYYRGGKKRTVTVTLGKAKGRLELLGGDNHFEFDFDSLRQQLRDLPIRDTLRQEMQTLREHLGNLKIDQKKVQDELRRSLEEARRALQRALQDSEAAKTGIEPAEKALRELEDIQIIEKTPSVTVRSSGKSVRSLVKSDDSGNIVIVWSPRPHLTAHDKDGKMLFDGEIATEAQREQVPSELWERVEPMLKETTQSED